MSTQYGTETRTPQFTKLWWLILISLSTVLGLQVFRVFITTLTYDFGSKYGQMLATIPALIVFLIPFLSPLVSRLVSPQRAIFAALGGLAVLRLLLQFSRSADVTMILSGAAFAFALVGLTLGIAQLHHSPAAGRLQLARGLFLGLTVDTALHSAFLTWDYAWQQGLIPLITAVVVSGLVLLALWNLRSAIHAIQMRESALRGGLSLMAVGPFFMLEMLFLQNVGFIASSALTSLEVAIAVVLLGNTLCFVALNFASRQPLPVRLAAGAVLIVLAVLLPHTTGLILLVFDLIGQAVLAMLLPSMLSMIAAHEGKPGAWRTSILVGTSSVLFALLAMLYYVSTLVTLPFSYTILPAIGAAIVLLTAFAQPIEINVPNWRLVWLPMLLLVIPLAVFLTRPTNTQTTPTSSTSSIRLVDYNIHQAVNPEGWLDPEAIATIIEAQNPGLVTLQEVSRGWLLAGGLDVAEWLARRLNMNYIYAPGHDYQFGNIILSRMPIKEWSFTRLPLHEVPLGRSVIRATIDMGNGTTMLVFNTHLSAFAGSSERIPQVEKILDVWAQAPCSIIVGDMNAHPGDGDMVLYQKAGLTSAQDATGNGNLFTFSSTQPDERIDWIFGSSDIRFSDFKVLRSTASDHLPLAVTITVQ